MLLVLPMTISEYCVSCGRMRCPAQRAAAAAVSVRARLSRGCEIKCSDAEASSSLSTFTHSARYLLRTLQQRLWFARAVPYISSPPPASSGFDLGRRCLPLWNTKPQLLDRGGGLLRSIRVQLIVLLAVQDIFAPLKLDRPCLGKVMRRRIYNPWHCTCPDWTCGDHAVEHNAKVLHHDGDIGERTHSPATAAGSFNMVQGLNLKQSCQRCGLV